MNWKKRTFLKPFSILAFAGAMGTGMAGTPMDSRFQETIFASDPSNLGSPVRMAWAPDGSNRLFVARYHGKVQIMKNGQLLPAPFAKMNPIYSNGESGLLGICFDPNFAVNRFVYVFVSVSTSEQQIIRYTDNDDVGTDRTVLIAGLPNLGVQHCGGALIVGPDGKLYWGIGDLGKRVGVKDNLTSLASKIGRANLDGSVPTDNPFADGPGPNNDYIWARGFRNPFTITVNPATGLLFVNSVGHNYEQIFAVSRGDHGGWDLYETDQPAGFAKPKIKYKTNQTDRRFVKPDGAIRQNNIVTITTADPHGLLRGEPIVMRDAEQNLSPTFYGSFFVLTVVNAYTFTFVQAGPDEVSGGGRVEMPAQGGSVTGGAFYNGTSFPPEFSGNYFYGDFNSGKIMRVTFDSNNEVIDNHLFVSDAAQLVDITVGPDGALYYMGHNNAGTVYRLAPVAAQPNLIVEPAMLNFSEGGTGSFTVRLSHAPDNPVTVLVSRAAGDSSLSVISGSTLVFTAENWNVPQQATVAATSVADGADSRATFSVSAAGFLPWEVAAVAKEVDPVPLAVSTTSIEFNEGGTATFDVQLTAAPPGELTARVSIVPESTAITLRSPATLVFNTSNFANPQTVILEANEDDDLNNSTVAIHLAGPGLLSQNVNVVIVDNDPLAPTFISIPPNSVTAGTTFIYRPKISANPPAAFSLLAGPYGMAIDTASGTIAWPALVPGSYDISLQAANGILPAATHNFVLTVLPDAPPVSAITKPSDGQIVSGNSTEWFGDGRDDLGTVRAEFYVDDILVYTDINDEGHYHFGGEHLGWDTTALRDGPHRLKLVVWDTKGQAGTAEIGVTVKNQTQTDYEADVSPRPDGSRSGAVELADWIQIGRFAVGIETANSPAEFQRADCAPLELNGNLVKGNGSISIEDWVQAGRYAAGLDGVTAAGGPEEPNRAEATALIAESASRSIRSRLVIAAPGDIISVPIDLESTGAENAVGFSLEFPTDKLEFRTSRLADPASGAVLQFNSRFASNGRVGLAVALPASRAFPTGRHALAELEFKVNPLATGSIPIRFSDAPLRRGLADAFARTLSASFENGLVTVDATPASIAAFLRSNGSVAIEVLGIAGRNYSVQVSEDLGHWSLLGTSTADSEGVAQFEDLSGPPRESRFYRLAQP